MKNLAIKLLIFLFVICLFVSCGARKKDMTKTTESNKIESTDKSKTDKSENVESNLKKSEKITVNNQDQTTTIEETVEPIDASKEAVFTDAAGKKQSLVNGKKTTKTTIKSNNTKTDTAKEATEALKIDKKESETKDVNFKAHDTNESVEIAVKRDAFSLWNFAWLLIPVGLYLVYRNWRLIANKSQILFSKIF